MTRTEHENDKRILLWILSGDPRVLPDKLKPKRERTKPAEAAFLAETRPETFEAPTRRNRQKTEYNDAMHEGRAWARETMYESVSDKVEGHPATTGKPMSNRQKRPLGFNQSPCHRDIQPNETPNINPAWR